LTAASPGPWVRQADLAVPRDADHYRVLLDAYASDPLGQGEPLPPAVLEKVVADLQRHRGARVFLAGTGNGTVAFATCFLGYSTFRAAPLMNIHDIAVLPEFRGRGIARALLQKIAARARDEGCCKLTLEVRADNPPARALYAAEGFSPARLNGRETPYLFLVKALDQGG
jgi:GNAT superfamily N-acetyltransferase